MEKRKVFGIKHFWNKPAGPMHMTGLARLVEGAVRLMGLAQLTGLAQLMGLAQLTGPGTPVHICLDRPGISFLSEIRYWI